MTDATPIPLTGLVPDDRLTAVLERFTDARASEGPEPTWPEDVAPAEVTHWLQTKTPDPAIAAEYLDVVRGGLDAKDPRQRAVGAFVARVYRSWRAVEADRQRPAYALPANREAHDLVRAAARQMRRQSHGGSRTSLDLRHPSGHPDGSVRFEVVAPGGGTAGFTIAGKKLRDVTIDAMKRFLTPEGMRHLAAVLCLLSTRGGRTGRFFWTVDSHIEAMGLTRTARHHPDLRQRCRNMIRLLTRFEVAVHNPDGTLRARQRFLSIDTEFDKRVPSGEWEVEGLELHISPILYAGVRDVIAGEPGKNWWPVPTELAHIDHMRFPYAIGLGQALAIRWRWDAQERDHVPLRGATLLDLAGITLRKKDPEEAWRMLRETLDELVHRNALERYEWPTDPWAGNTVCKLYAPKWARDRVVHKVRPAEDTLAIPPPPATGATLKAWRKTKRYNQAQAAKALGVSVITVKRAEAPAHIEEPLNKSLSEALAQASIISAPSGGQGYHFRPQRRPGVSFPPPAAASTQITL